MFFNSTVFSSRHRTDTPTAPTPSALMKGHGCLIIMFPTHQRHQEKRLTQTIGSKKWGRFVAQSSCV